MTGTGTEQATSRIALLVRQVAFGVVVGPVEGDLLMPAGDEDRAAQHDQRPERLDLGVGQGPLRVERGHRRQHGRRVDAVVVQQGGHVTASSPTAQLSVRSPKSMTPSGSRAPSRSAQMTLSSVRSPWTACRGSCGGEPLDVRPGRRRRRLDPFRRSASATWRARSATTRSAYCRSHCSTRRRCGCGEVGAGPS